MAGERKQWLPFLSAKQWETLAACKPAQRNLVLLSGPRWAGKTISALHALAQHGWETHCGNVAMLTITQSVGVDSGVWPDLVETILPEWIGGSFGMEWVKRPYTQNVTKKPACKVSNQYGKVTTFQLDSLKNEGEVEERYKGKRYSCIFINELSKFRSRKTFDTLNQCLRMVGLAEKSHLLLCDTNPADEGEDSWIHELWYQFRTCPDDRLIEFVAPGVDPSVLKPLRDRLQLVEFTVDDNPFITPDKKASLMADFAHDEDLLARYFYGKWVAAAVDAIFYKVFRPMVHVIGEAATPVNTEPETMVPEDGCIQLYTGWDLGDTHSAFGIAEKVMTYDAPRKGDVASFKILDELVVHDDFNLSEFVHEARSKCEYWEKVIGRPVIWKHYSDRNVFSRKELDGDLYLNQLVHQTSEGFFELVGAWDAQRGASVDRRVDFLRRLMFENRWFVSRSKCPHTIAMCKGMKRKENATSGIAKGSKHKHIFDALTYISASECYEEIANAMVNSLRKLKTGESSLIQVPM